MERPNLTSVVLPAHSAVMLQNARTEELVFEKQVPDLGRLWLRKLRLPEDLQVLHSWVSQEYARYWGMVGFSPAQVATGYAEIERRAQVYLGFHGAHPAFLVETYSPGQDAIGAHYDVQPGDMGMHVLVAPPAVPIAGFTEEVFSAVMDFLFSHPQTERVVVEPDIRNRRIHALNRRAGFRYQKVVALPHKTAHLAFCTRAHYLEQGRREAKQVEDVIAHLQPEIWSAVNAALIRKAIAEFSHELLLQPKPVIEKGNWHHYALPTELPDTKYLFRARLLSLDHWDIDPRSIEKLCDGQPAPLDASEFILEFKNTLGISPEMLPVYLEEITSTLYAGAYKRYAQTLSAADLVHADFQEIETAMTDGHPSFVANSGRIGFDAVDYLAYAPEAGSPVQLVWLAAHKRNTQFTSSHDVAYEQMMQEELGAETLASFAQTLRTLGLDPAQYLLLPVHPWQWFNRLSMVFAPDIASRDLVCLGYGPDCYRAQQSIRTFFNTSHPTRRYVKTALSVLNMGFMRGLSADYMKATPAINDWIAQLVKSDAYFAEKGFGILREVAGIGYRNPHFEAAVAKQSPYRKMLAALWRESPIPQLKPGQRLMTMAALLHRDRDGVALLPQLIQASGLETGRWVARYLDCYLAPLVHCLYQYDLAFMPHGENVILLLEENVPAKAFLKDIAEEAVVMDSKREVPELVRRICVDIPEPLKILSIFTDVFDGILRYVAQILLEQGAYAEESFWRCVADCLETYRQSHPELAEKFERYDLFTPEFQRSCLNRLQLRNNVQMVDLTDPSSALQFAGTLKNPIAVFNSHPKRSSAV